MDSIRKYFPDLSPRQTEQFEALMPLYLDWNSKINVISRADIGNLYPHHVLHSLAIAKMTSFADGTNIADIGTGGGFPGIPLAILFPECSFTLIDSIAKKMRVARAVAQEIGLTNVEFRNDRAENVKEKFDFAVSRGVMPLPDLCKLARGMIDHKNQHNAYPNGVFCLKGGDITAEMAGFRQVSDAVPVSEWFSEEYFKGKMVIYVQL